MKRYDSLQDWFEKNGLEYRQHLASCELNKEREIKGKVGDMFHVIPVHLLINGQIYEAEYLKYSGQDGARKNRYKLPKPVMMDKKERDEVWEYWINGEWGDWFLQGVPDFEVLGG